MACLQEHKTVVGLGDKSKSSGQKSILYYFPLIQENLQGRHPVTSPKLAGDYTCNAPSSPDKDNEAVGNLSPDTWDLNWSVDPGFQTRCSTPSLYLSNSVKSAGSMLFANDSFNLETNAFNFINKLHGEDSHEPLDPSNIQSTLILTQIRVRFLLSAKTSQLIFDKINSLHQDISIAKANLQLLVSLIKYRVSQCCTPCTGSVPNRGMGHCW